MLKPYSHYTDMPGYLGDEHPGFLIALEGDGLLFEANETYLLDTFKLLNAIEDTDYIRTSIGGWMGSCNFLLVNEKHKALVAAAEIEHLRMAAYPVLDEEVYSNLQTAEAERRWNGLLKSDRANLSAKYFDGHRYTSLETVRQQEDWWQLEEWLLID